MLKGLDNVTKRLVIPIQNHGDIREVLVTWKSLNIYSPLRQLRGPGKWQLQVRCSPWKNYGTCLFGGNFQTYKKQKDT